MSTDDKSLGERLKLLRETWKLTQEDMSVLMNTFSFLSFKTLHALHPLDQKLMGLVMEGVQNIYKEENARLDNRSSGEVAAKIYMETLELCRGSTEIEDQKAALHLTLVPFAPRTPFR